MEIFTTRQENQIEFLTERETEIEEDLKGPDVIDSEIEQAIKGLKRGKAE